MTVTDNIGETVDKTAVPGLDGRSNLKEDSESTNSSVLKGFCPWEQEKRNISVMSHKLKSAISHSFRPLNHFLTD